MIFAFRKKRVDPVGGVSFFASRDGGLRLDRKTLHESPGYRRQIEALQQITLNLKKPPRQPD